MGTGATKDGTNTSSSGGTQGGISPISLLPPATAPLSVGATPALAQAASSARHSRAEESLCAPSPLGILPANSDSSSNAQVRTTTHDAGFGADMHESATVEKRPPKVKPSSKKRKAQAEVVGEGGWTNTGARNAERARINSMPSSGSPPAAKVNNNNSSKGKAGIVVKKKPGRPRKVESGSFLFLLIDPGVTVTFYVGLGHYSVVLPRLPGAPACFSVLLLGNCSHLYCLIGHTVEMLGG